MSLADRTSTARRARLPFLATIVAGLALPLLANAGPVRFEGEGHAENPVWSLNGKFLSFEVNRFAGDIDMYFTEVNGDIAKDAVIVKLPGGGSSFGGSGQVVLNAAWHPGGIAVFEGTNSGGQSRLYFAQPGGASAAEMLDTKKAPGSLTFPAISPDGDVLAYVTDNTGGGDVALWNRSTNAITAVTSTPETEVYPTFSKDGTQLLFTRKKDNDEDVFGRAVAGGPEKSVAGGSGDQTRPAFAADGHIVFFQSGSGEGAWDLAEVDSAGAKKVLAKGIRLPVRARPALTPDGKWVAYGWDDPTKNTKIVLTKVDGSATVEIPTDYVAVGEPALTVQNGRTLLAFTALPSASADWRLLTVVDITDAL